MGPAAATINGNVLVQVPRGVVDDSPLLLLRSPIKVLGKVLSFQVMLWLRA